MYDGGLGVEKNTVTMAGSRVWKAVLRTFPSVPRAAVPRCKETERQLISISMSGSEHRLRGLRVERGRC